MITMVFLTSPDFPEENHHIPPIYDASTPGRAEAIYFMYGTRTLFHTDTQIERKEIIYFIVYVPAKPAISPCAPG